MLVVRRRAASADRARAAPACRRASAPAAPAAAPAPRRSPPGHTRRARAREPWRWAYRGGPRVAATLAPPTASRHVRPMTDDLRARVASFLERFAKRARPGAATAGRRRRRPRPARLGGGRGAGPGRTGRADGTRGSGRRPAGHEALLRQLLTASFTATGDAAFALHPETGEVYLRVLRSLFHLEYEEFEDLVHTVATVADRLGRPPGAGVTARALADAADTEAAGARWARVLRAWRCRWR
jgi:hypothetical protein